MTCNKLSSLSLCCLPLLPQTTGADIIQRADIIHLPMTGTTKIITPVVGQYVAAIYDNEWYIGIVKERSDEHGDVTINFMSRNRNTNIIAWPSPKDECAVPLQNVLCMISAPVVCGSTGRQHKLSEDSLSHVMHRFTARVQS